RMRIMTTRRNVLASISGAAALGAKTRSFAQSPVGLHLSDVGVHLQLQQEAIERFRDQNQNLVSRITFSRAPSPELPAKLKAMQNANRVDIDLVLTGPGA